jgi:hypothetical protein
MMLSRKHFIIIGAVALGLILGLTVFFFIQNRQNAQETVIVSPVQTNPALLGPTLNQPSESEGQELTPPPEATEEVIQEEEVIE